jgi:hypothetical protein
MARVRTIVDTTRLAQQMAAATDATRAVNRILANLGTNRVTATRLAQHMAAATDTTRLIEGLNSARMVREIAAGLDSNGLLREAFANLDTSRMVREAFPRFDNTAMMREAFKVFEPSQLQRAVVNARDLLEAEGFGLDDLTAARGPIAGSASARAPLLPGLADPWGQIRNMQLKDWIPIWISLVGLLLAWMALHPQSCLSPEEIEQVVRTVQAGVTTTSVTSPTTKAPTTTTPPPTTTRLPPSTTTP